MTRALRVTHRLWEGSDLTYSLVWGGHCWTLALDQDRPGLRRAEDPAGCVQSLVGLAARGRSDFHAFTSRSLIGVELSGSSVQATYAPPGWAGLQVRASWTPAVQQGGLDFEVQMLTPSVGELRSVEIHVGSTLFDPGTEPNATPSMASWVTPREARSAALSYDGRESPSDLRYLTTLPVPDSADAAFAPVSLASPWPDQSGCYLEMVHPHDISRRIVQTGSREPHFPGSVLGVRYGLFGHDLEKGVIVRGRLRGLWISPESTIEAHREAYQDFLKQPPPLGP
jgi:hypothetical protein